MIFRTMLTLMVLLLAVTASAQTTVILSQIPDGTYVVTAVNGKATFTPAVTATGGTTPVPPLPPGPNPPTPDPDELTARARAIRDEAGLVQGDRNRDRTAQELAAVYRTVAAEVDKGTLKGNQIITAVSRSTDMLMRLRGVADSWQPVRDKVSEYWASVAQAGGGDAEYAQLLTEAADGLEASVANPQAINWAFILKLVMMIIQMITDLTEPMGVAP